MKQYRDLADFIERSAPNDYATLKRTHPDAGALLSTTRVLGTSDALPTAQETAAARDFARSGLAALEDKCDALIKIVSRRLQITRAIKLTGAIIAMASSIGLAASALDLLTVDRKTAALSLSAISFTGAAMAALSDALGGGAGRGADPASLLHRLSEARGLIAAAQTKRFAAEAGAGGSIFDVLTDLNEAAHSLAAISSLFKAS